MRKVPKHIQRPDYAETSIPSSELQEKADRTIEIKSKEDIEILREVGLLAR